MTYNTPYASMPHLYKQKTLLNLRPLISSHSIILPPSIHEGHSTRLRPIRLPNYNRLCPITLPHPVKQGTLTRLHSTPLPRPIKKETSTWFRPITLYGATGLLHVESPWPRYYLPQQQDLIQIILPVSSPDPNFQWAAWQYNIPWPRRQPYYPGEIIEYNFLVPETRSIFPQTSMHVSFQIPWSHNTFPQDVHICLPIPKHLPNHPLDFLQVYIPTPIPQPISPWDFQIINYHWPWHQDYYYSISPRGLHPSYATIKDPLLSQFSQQRRRAGFWDRVGDTSIWNTDHNPSIFLNDSSFSLDYLEKLISNKHDVSTCAPDLNSSITVSENSFCLNSNENIVLRERTSSPSLQQVLAEPEGQISHLDEILAHCNLYYEPTQALIDLVSIFLT